ncbi:hypothetical protein ACEPAG_2837 [Sanghuangporus baumii]
MATSPQSSPFSTLAFSFANLSISPQENQVVNLTGYLEEIDGTTFACGGYADLYKYRCRAFIFDPGAENAVFAVKAPRMKFVMDRDKSIAKMHREIGVWASLRHDNVLKLHGILYRNNNPLPSLVSDFMEKGTAVQYLDSCTDADLIELIRDAAKGLSYLHERDIAHGDIKGDNILVGGDGRARIADFGLSRMLGTNGLPVEVTTTDANRSSRWHAVEYFDFTTAARTTGPTKSADVWSFGCTVLQFFSGMWPFYDAVEPGVALRLSKGELPKFPPHARNPEFEKHRAGIVAFCRLCWVRNPDLRPQMCVLEEVACSDFWDETCMVGTNRDTASSEFSRQEPSRADENDESESNSTKPLSEDRSRSRSSSESTVVGTPPEVENIKIPVIKDPPEETGPDHPPQDTPVDQAEANSENAAPVNQPVTIPSPPPPSLEDILSARHITPQEILNEFAMTTHVFTIQYADGESTGPPHLRTHVMKCMGKFLNGEEYGVGSVPGRKKQAKERAALVALRRLYLENPADFNLRYSPILRAYLDENDLTSRVTWSRQSGPSPDDPTRWEHRATFIYDGNVVAIGVGPTANIAEEHAARMVEAEWSDGIANTA